MAELKIALAKLIRVFNVTLDYDAPSVEMFPCLILKSKKGFFMKFEALEQNPLFGHR